MIWSSKQYYMRLKAARSHDYNQIVSSNNKIALKL